ncbi:MAG TPA: 1-deoxy-D-xylulose-5-phosphate synthase [Verrucomicrobiae bacterium]|nr:1-deoxy-D-xylulose-5-phosphate synthase [Verrucomicrobiae bacterium]
MGRYLDMINSPADVKMLTLDQLQMLAQEIREELIHVLSKNGGHLGPNLGVVELTLALHRCFDCPHDRFVWDVSHQIYVHKLLTGRRAAFRKIRQSGGPMGFAFRAESPYDCYGAGHAGTALSAALGMAVARDRAKTNEHVVAIVGDAALTNGITYEALNNIKNSTKRLIVILNDNEWSIAKNVGAISDYLNRVVRHPSYAAAHKRLEHFIERIPRVGSDLAQIGHRVGEAVKGIIVPSLVFEEFGLRYLGPLDGHDTKRLIETFDWAKTQDVPVLIHILTKKGKGYDKAIEDPQTFHGCGPFDIATGKAPAKKEGAPPNYQDVFGDAMVRFCDLHAKLVGITAAMPSGTSLIKLQKAKPDRYFDVGIAEEHAVLFAAGMATMGYRPVCAIYSTFLQRAYDCIIHDVALQNLDVIFAMDRGGLSANDGPTHHGVFDISYGRCVPRAILMAPKDEDELVDMLWTALQHHGPIFIRYPRGAGEGVPIKERPSILPVGKAEVLHHGTDVAIIFYGAVLKIAQDTAAALEAEGLSVALINARFCKPIDREMLERYGRICKVVCTIEDHVLMGGFGSAVLETLADLHIDAPLARVGWPDNFLEHATSNDELRDKYGLNSRTAVAKVQELLAESRARQAKPVQQFRVLGAAGRPA